MLLDCCGGISRALGFERVIIEIADADSDQLRLRASVGWDEGPPEGVNSLDDVARSATPPTRSRAATSGRPTRPWRASARQARRYESQRNGHGPLAWDHHWLMVPLTHADGRIGGWIWPDDPSDHLLPTPAKLRILRTFANQALAAVSDAAHVDQLKALAQLDGLTGALNRRAFLERLDLELQRARRSNTRRHRRDVRPRPVQGPQRRPRAPGRRRRPAQLHEDPRAQRPHLGRGGTRRRRRVRADPRRRGRRRRGRHPRSDRHHPRRRTPPAMGEVRASYGTARAPDDGWTRRCAGRGGRPTPVRPQAPAPRRPPAHLARRGRAERYT